ncbi:MAG: methyltransferase [Thermomicrobiales bacterium]|nr:methyltransferase [Thermomicrobiales bacterium]
MADRVYSDNVNAHYGAPNLGEEIRAALRAAGKEESPTPDDLAALDQFHTGGTISTRELADRAGLHAGQTVLDVGGGIGGPARTLASVYGCSVTVLDLTEAFCEAGKTLSALTGLSDLVTFRHGDALAIPFADSQFDVVWTQHSSMNIGDKERLYTEIHRVLRPGGRLALHEIMAGPVQPVHFPVPWSRDPTISFLRPPEEIRSLLSNVGIAEISWADVTSSSLAWFQAWTDRPSPSGPSPLGLHVLLGPEFREMGRNMLRNLDEGRITVVQGVFERPC